MRVHICNGLEHKDQNTSPAISLWALIMLLEKEKKIKKKGKCQCGGVIENKGRVKDAGFKGV